LIVMLNIFCSVFFLVVASQENDTCDWAAMEESVSLFHTGWAHHQACAKAFRLWQYDSPKPMTAESCECLIGWGEPLLNQFECELGDKTLVQWKASCSEKYCITDNPAEFCYCNQDELKNVWKSMGMDVHDICSDISQDWNDGSHIFTQPDPHSCRCFHVMGHNRGQDLGCKWQLNDFTKPWEKYESMASFAKKCVDKNFTEEQFQNYYEEEVFMKPLSRKIKPIKNLRVNDDQDSIHNFLFGTLFLIALLMVAAIFVYKCYVERSGTQTRRRKKMVALPSIDTLDNDEEEYGLDSEESLEAGYSMN